MGAGWCPPDTLGIGIGGTAVHQTGPALWKNKIAVEHAIEVK